MNEQEIKDIAYKEVQELMSKCQNIFQNYLNSKESVLTEKMRILVVSRASNGLMSVSNNMLNRFMNTQEKYIQDNLIDELDDKEVIIITENKFDEIIESAMELEGDFDSVHNYVKNRMGFKDEKRTYSDI